ncbi:MAG: hydroxymethylglutaryl-CoA synthase [Verrucomicrobia bacterium]|nr:hydroxymethylglutaryl-CoA synthase [Verrucomicrobiota bacterium]
MKSGIDLISFYSSKYFLSLEALAEKRGVDVAKFHVGLGQFRMAIPPPDEDVVTMGASAAKPLLASVDPQTISLLLFATESGVDQSKAAGLFVHKLLGLSSRCRVVELKEACYSGTAAIRLAASVMENAPGQNALVVCSDIARYDMGSPGEPTQGAGAVAMIINSSPRILCLDDACGLYAEDVMDFWRPNYRDEALVDGKYSAKIYLSTVSHTWKEYVEHSGLKIDDFTKICYHLPFTNMAKKAQVQLFKAAGRKSTKATDVDAKIAETLAYNMQTGNCYTASLYEGFACLLDTCKADLAQKRIGFFSYGSGCMGEFFSGIVQPGYQDVLFTVRHQALLENRTELSYQAYEDIFNLKVPEDGWEYVFAQYSTGPFRFGGVSGHKRRYEEVE